MTYHLSRDFNSSVSNGFTQLYILAIFLRRVMGFTIVGKTGFDLDGSLLIASGTGASINLGTGLENHISVPSGTRTVTGSDIGSILCLKSAAHPTFNSGIFRITGIDAANNAYIVDYRSTDFPPAESGTLLWYVFQSDAAITWSNGANGITSGYQSNGSATTARIILQSPHSTGWQVRLCNESPADQSTNESTPHASITPGFGGDTYGDFAVFGQHTHSTLFYNSGTNLYGAGVVGTDGINGDFRIYAAGDDGGQNIVFFTRTYSPQYTVNHSLVSFGIPDNEPTPLPLNNINRLYVSGNTWQANNAFTTQCTWSWAPTGNGGGLQGMAFGLGGTPVICTPGAWCYLSGNSQAAGATYNTSAGDSPWISATELLTVNICAGTQRNQYSIVTASQNIYPLESRIMGTFPWLRQGRNNFGNFVLTTDTNKSWFSLTGSVFLQWGGPGLVP